MNGIANSFVDTTVQCWGCPLFDRLFQVISTAAAAIYSPFTILCLGLFFFLFSSYVSNVVWQSARKGNSDPFYKKSIQHVFINSIVAMALLGMGVAVPRLMTMITFEPTAQIAEIYTQSMLKITPEEVNEKVTYKPMPMKDNGFYRPQLRDTIIMLMKTTITQFQSYMKLGIAVMDSAFSWRALLGVGAFIKHIIMFCIGLYLFYGFFKLFARFCFYFADIIVAMAFFAFFFPLSLMLTAFKGAEHVPAWMSGLGKNVGTNQFKNLINAIISLSAAVITYTVMMVIIAKFFSAPGQSVADLMEMITTGQIFEGELSHENLEAMTLTSAIVLVYVLNFIYSQIPQVTQMVLNVFNVSESHKLGDQLANDAEKLVDNAIQITKNIGSKIISGGDAAKDDKGAADNKKDKK